MRDYAEQIDSIRRCAESDDPVYECCFEDCNQHHGRRDNMCRQKIMMDAADAIEELLAEVEHWKLEAAANETDRKYLIDENRKLVNSLMNFRVPTWISVEERLPDVAEKVLTYNGDFVSENWLCTVASKVGRINVWAYSEGFVTHWMPLPKPPKEVE